jgi:ribosomal protein S21
MCRVVVVPLRSFFLLFQQVKSMVNCFIQIEPNESVESMWRRFRKATDRSGVFKDMQRAQHFVPKPQRRAAKSQRARKKVKEYGGT